MAQLKETRVEKEALCVRHEKSGRAGGFEEGEVWEESGEVEEADGHNSEDDRVPVKERDVKYKKREKVNLPRAPDVFTLGCG